MVVFDFFFIYVLICLLLTTTSKTLSFWGLKMGYLIISKGFRFLVI